MSYHIQIDNISEELHETLASRAMASGMSLADYVRGELERLARQPTMKELTARIAELNLPRIESDEMVRYIHEAREEREQQLSEANRR
jgi:hypothetical protein